MDIFYPLKNKLIITKTSLLNICEIDCLRNFYKYGKESRNTDDIYNYDPESRTVAHCFVGCKLAEHNCDRTTIEFLAHNYETFVSEGYQNSEGGRCKASGIFNKPRRSRITRNLVFKIITSVFPCFRGYYHSWFAKEKKLTTETRRARKRVNL